MKTRRVDTTASATTARTEAMEAVRTEALEPKKTVSKRSTDLTNRRFNHLTALSPTPEKRNGYTVWRCVCDCGLETVVRQSSLMSGHTTSCGCQKEPTRTLVDGTCVEIVRAAVEKKTVPKNNTSGVRGVYWSRTRGLWIAQITFKGKTRYLGGYKTIGEAKRARREAEERLFVEFLEEYDSAGGDGGAGTASVDNC